MIDPVTGMYLRGSSAKLIGFAAPGKDQRD